MMFPNPRLVKAETIQIFDKLKVPLYRQRRILIQRMKWRKERAEPQLRLLGLDNLHYGLLYE